MSAIRRFAIAQRDEARRSVRRIAFCHVPKCAGSSVSRSIQSGAFSIKERLLLRSFGLELHPAAEAAEFAGMTYQAYIPKLLAYQLASPNVRFAAGHIYCPPDIVDRFSDRWSFVTILRDPVERWISAYTYDTFKKIDWKKNTLDFDQYIDSPDGIYNGQTFLHYFSNYNESSPSDQSSLEKYADEAVQNIKNFKVFGFVEHMENWISEFEESFSVKLQIPSTNKSPNKDVAKKIKSDQTLLKKIREICSPDLYVYQKIAEHKTQI